MPRRAQERAHGATVAFTMGLCCSGWVPSPCQGKDLLGAKVCEQVDAFAWLKDACSRSQLGRPGPWTWIDQGVAGIIDQSCYADVILVRVSWSHTQRCDTVLLVRLIRLGIVCPPPCRLDS